VADFFQDNHQHTQVDTRLVVQEILKRANQKLTPLLHSQDPDEILSALKKIQTDMLHFGALFKSVCKETSRLDFSDIRGLDLCEINGNELTTEQKEKMFAVFSENYANEPEFIERFQRFLFEESDEMKAKRQKNTFHLLTKTAQKHGEQSLAFLRLEDMGDNRLYFAACNVHPELRGSGIGNKFLQQTIGEAGKTKTIEATFPPDSPIGTYYIETLGFVGVGMHSELGKYARFSMSREAGELSASLKKQTPQELGRLAIEQDGKLIQELIQQGVSPVVIELDAEKQKEKIFSLSTQLFEAGYTMPRYYCTEASCRKRIYGFEKKASLT
jgi:predicted GNAT family N-acyltransferase